MFASPLFVAEAPIENGLATQGDLGGRRCVVLGAGGFIGGALCTSLAASGASVLGVGRRMRPADFPAMAQWRSGNLTSVPDLRAVLADADVIFHLVSGALPVESNKNPAQDILDALVPTVRLLDVARECGVRKVVFTSSGGTIYGAPTATPIAESAPTLPISAYGVGKLAIEKYLHLYKHLHGLDFLALRVANPYGPRQDFTKTQGLVASVMHRTLTGAPIEVWGDGEVVRDFVHVDDVAAALCAAAVYQGSETVMNIGSGQGFSVLQVIADVAAAAGVEQPAITWRPGRPADVPVNVLDIGLARRELGWRPAIDWRSGLIQTADWMRGVLARDGDATSRSSST
jgi:UDP-glucose 4-epimerase